jgi:hypothetical protein
MSGSRRPEWSVQIPNRNAPSGRMTSVAVVRKAIRVSDVWKSAAISA